LSCSCLALALALTQTLAHKMGQWNFILLQQTQIAIAAAADVDDAAKRCTK